jgi:uncharacterized phage infection (PIP) family protein YhgE
MGELINTTQYLDLVGLKKYDGLIKLFIEKGDKDLADQIASLAAKIGNLDVEGSDDKTLAEIVDAIYESIKVLGEKDAELEEDIKGIIGEVSESVTLLTLSEVSSKLKDLETANIVNRVTTLEGVIDDLKNLGGENGLVAVVDKVNTNMAAIETLNGEGEGSVKKAAADAQAAANEYADTLNTEMDERVKAIEAIDHDKLVADAVAAVVAGAESEFDTLKEVAEWIAADTTGSAELQTTVSGHTESINTINDDIDALEAKVDEDITILKTHMTDAATKIEEIDGRLDVLDAFVELHEAISEFEIEGLFKDNTGSDPEA